MKLFRGLCVGLGLIALARGASSDWELKPATGRIDFSVHATGDSFVGHLAGWEARFTSGNGGRPAAGSLAFPLSGLQTGKADRDRQMLAWLEAARFPTARFVLQTLAPAAGGFEASGTFTFHGVTRPIAFPVQVGLAGGRRTVDGTATLDYREWNLKIFRKFGLLKVDPLVKVSFHLEAAR